MPPSALILADLRVAYAASNLIAFVGAGIPKAAGLPDWPALAQLLRDRLHHDGKPADVLAEVDDLIVKRHLIDALSAIKLALGEHEFNIAVEKAVDDSKRAVPDVATAIAELAPKLRAVFTTNLDHFLERAFGGAWDPFTSAQGDLAQRGQYIFKYHGTRRDRSTWVFTREQYDRAIFSRPQDRTLFRIDLSSLPHPIHRLWARRR